MENTKNSIRNILDMYHNLLPIIKENIAADTTKLIFKKGKISQSDIFSHNQDAFNFAVEQIFLRQKFKHKFPTLTKNFDFIFHSRLNCEQASSEYTAEYKANILTNYKTSIDLTGGLGVDSLAFAKKAQAHYYLEVNENLCSYFEKNVNNLEIENIKIINSSAEDFFATNQNNLAKFDIIYLDPDRRKNNKRFFLLEDLQPNLLELQNVFFKYGKNILIKLSPLFDITKTEKELKNIAEIHIVSVENECKELLVLINENAENIKYFAVNLTKDKENKIIQNIVKFEKNQESKISYNMPQKYIYEPNSSLMKLAFWSNLAEKYNFEKLHKNSHLFTASHLIKSFYGRKFEVIAIENFNKKEVLKHIGNDKKANVAVRNFPYSTQEIYKKLGLKEGGNIYIFATTTIDDKLKILITTKINED